MSFLEVCGILFWVLVIVTILFCSIVAIGAKSEDEMKTKALKEQQLRKFMGNSI